MIESRGREEQGIALVVAVFSLAVIGALVGGIFFAARLEQQSGQNTFFAVQAAEAAEAGLSDAEASLAAATLEGLPIGGAPLDLGTLTLGDGVGASRQVTRLTASLFLIRARGVRQGAPGITFAERSLGLLVRLSPEAGGAAPPAKAVRLEERGWVQLY